MCLPLSFFLTHLNFKTYILDFMNLRAIRYSEQLFSEISQLLKFEGQEESWISLEPQDLSVSSFLSQPGYIPALVEDAEPRSFIPPDISSASCPQALAIALFLM